MKSRQIRKELKQRGFRLVRSTKHHIYRNDETGDTISLSHGTGTDRRPYTDAALRSLLRRFDRGQPIRKEMG